MFTLFNEISRWDEPKSQDLMLGACLSICDGNEEERGRIYLCSWFGLTDLQLCPWTWAFPLNRKETFYVTRELTANSYSAIRNH